MKRISIVLVSLSILVMAFSSALRAQATSELYVINAQEVKLLFTTKYDFNDLAKAKSALKELDIELTYTLLKFDKQGNLSQISATIEYPDGLKGSFTSRELTPTDNPGFRRKFTAEK